jgi:hypothetical protein
LHSDSHLLGQRNEIQELFLILSSKISDLPRPACEQVVVVPEQVTRKKSPRDRQHTVYAHSASVSARPAHDCHPASFQKRNKLKLSAIEHLPPLPADQAKGDAPHMACDHALTCRPLSSALSAITVKLIKERMLTASDGSCADLPTFELCSVSLAVSLIKE